jgi:hypothetical protein
LAVNVGKPKEEIPDINMEILLRVLASEMMFQEFEKHLIAEYAVESLYFLSHVLEWKKDVESSTETAKVALKARKMFKVYVENSGLYTINVSYKSAKEVSDKMMSENQEFEVNLFDSAFEDVARMLINGPLILFWTKRVHERRVRMETLVNQNELDFEIESRSRSRDAFRHGSRDFDAAEMGVARTRMLSKASIA